MTMVKSAMEMIISLETNNEDNEMKMNDDDRLNVRDEDWIDEKVKNLNSISEMLTLNIDREKRMLDV